MRIRITPIETTSRHKRIVHTRTASRWSVRNKSGSVFIVVMPVNKSRGTVIRLDFSDGKRTVNRLGYLIESNVAFTERTPSLVIEHLRRSVQD